MMNALMFITYQQDRGVVNKLELTHRSIRWANADKDFLILHP